MNNPPEPCTPFTECWCEQAGRENNPHCQPSLNIDTWIPMFILAAIIIGVIKLKR